MDEMIHDNSENYKINQKSFVIEFSQLFDEINNGIKDNSTLYINKISQFQLKYEKFDVNNNTIESINEFNKQIIDIIVKYHDYYNTENKLDIFYQVILDIIVIIFKLYNPDEFYYNTKLLDFFNLQGDIKNKLQLVYLNIGKKAIKRESKLDINEKITNKPLNEFLDILVLNVIEHADIKMLSVNNNLLSIYENKNSFLSFKLITLNLFILYEMKNFYKIFPINLTNIIKILSKEAKNYSVRMNDELFNNAFADFEYNVPKTSRKINNEEFNFLINLLFPSIRLILDILLYDYIQIDFTNIEIRILFFSLIESVINKEKKQLLDKEINLYKFYLTICFITDIFDFIFSNLHYLDEQFKESEGIDIDIDPFAVYSEKIRPRYFKEFLDFIIQIFSNSFSNIIMLIKDFLLLYDIKSSNENAIKEIEINEDVNYFICEPFNNIGFSVICWILWKSNKQNFYPSPYNSIYLFDMQLPIVAALLKRGNNFKFIGLELFFSYLNNINYNSISDLRKLKFYSYNDVIKDVIDFIGSSDPEKKRTYVSSNIHYAFKILKVNAIKQLFTSLLKEGLTIENKVNDNEISYIIFHLKNSINTNLKEYDKEFFHEIIDITLTDKFFVIDILDTLSQSLNFIHFLILKDKKTYNSHLGIFNQVYMYKILDKIKLIKNLINKWITCPDKDKEQFTNNTYNNQDITYSLNLLKNKAIITIDLMENVEKLINSYLKNNLEIL